MGYKLRGSYEPEKHEHSGFDLIVKRHEEGNNIAQVPR